ncbi:MAG: restriction endonuclease subunit S [Spirochaetales bacterium]|nr:restriction endonuclease subunit S [Spirochaetales bacterium]
MESEWAEYLLSDILEHVADNRGRNPKAYFENGIPVIDNSLITSDWRIDLTKSKRFIDSETYHSFIRKYIKEDDVLITLVGNGYGQVAITPKEKCVIIQNTVGLRCNSENSSRYLYYLLKGYRDILMNLNIGAAQPSIKVGNLLELSFTFPPLSEQKAIAHILGSLDDKIELNRKMNVTLEQIAQALFKSWFVDFDPVIDNAIIAGNEIPEELTERAEVRRKALADGTANRESAGQFPDAFRLTEEMGWIPAGWEIRKLSDLLEVKYGKDHKKLSEGSIPVYGSGGFMRYANKSLYKGESVLIPRKGTLSNILFLNEEFWTVDTMFYTIPKSDYIPKYAFHHLKRLDFTSMNVGSAVPSMTTAVLNELPILLPTKAVLQQFDFILTSYFDGIEANRTQSTTLTKLRDTLLPKLLSGELLIPDVEKLVEEVFE